jgi:hypothetical protein
VTIRGHKLTLQPSDIAENFTLEKIDERITAIMTAIGDAEASTSDSFNDTQAQQTVRRQSLADLNSSLAVWLKAKSIKTGSDSSCADLVAAEYNYSWPRI